MQKHANLVDLVKSFPTNILLQNLASIQERTSPLKFAHLAEKSESASISNLSTKVSVPVAEHVATGRALSRFPGPHGMHERKRDLLMQQPSQLVEYFQTPVSPPWLYGEREFEFQPGLATGVQ